MCYHCKCAVKITVCILYTCVIIIVTCVFVYRRLDRGTQATLVSMTIMGQNLKQRLIIWTQEPDTASHPPPPPPQMD